MSSHERFEELCTIAAAGEITAAERQELLAHIEDCASCRKTFADMQEIHATWLPEREGFEIERSFAAESRLRQLVLQRAAADGVEFSTEAQLPRVGESPLVRPANRRIPYRVLAAAAVITLALVGAGILAKLHSDGSATAPQTIAQSSATDPLRTTAPDSTAAELEVVRTSLRESQTAQRSLETTLKEAQSEKAQLERQLEEAEGRAGNLQQSNSAALQEVSSLQAQLETARANESRVEEQLASVKKSDSDKETELALVESENKDLREKASLQTVSVDRERELMADGREIRDLIAARNLHIIDVYDTSGAGQTQKTFGRVFYTEGKSLVFYAYDLPARHPETKYAFYAWGKRDVSGDVKVRNLGIFYSDDTSQHRWVLKITDPHMLSEIDSVFVTLEKTDPSLSPSPTGKKLLSAYLGSPANHP